MFPLKMKTLRGVSWPHKFLKAIKCNIDVKISLTPLWQWFYYYYYYYFEIVSHTHTYVAFATYYKPGLKY